MSRLGAARDASERPRVPHHSRRGTVDEGLPAAVSCCAEPVYVGSRRREIGALIAELALLDENTRLRAEIDEVRAWFTNKPWAEPLDPSSFGGHPYTETERALGYGTFRDPRFLPAALGEKP